MERVGNSTSWVSELRLLAEAVILLSPSKRYKASQSLYSPAPVLLTVKPEIVAAVEPAVNLTDKSETLLDPPGILVPVEETKLALKAAEVLIPLQPGVKRPDSTPVTEVPSA